MLEEFERTSFTRSTYFASLVGAVTGPTVVLGCTVAAALLIARWSTGLGLAISVMVGVGTLLAAVELLRTVQLKSEMTRVASEEAWRGVLLSVIAEFALFVIALCVLWDRLPRETAH
jgi:hypothetical protein